MRFCVNYELPNEVLSQAEELKVPYKDRDLIVSLAEKYPEAEFVVDCFYASEIDYAAMKRYNILSKNKVVLCVKTVSELLLAKENGLGAYIGFPVESFYDLKAIISLEPNYILLGPELFFRIDEVKKFGVKVRAVPNVAYQDGLPHGNGIHGTWIPPGAIELYENYIDTIEFADCDTFKERTLFRLYKEQTWDTRLSTVITNLETEAVGRMILNEVFEQRLNCGHKCQHGRSCHICERILKLANPELYEDMSEQKKRF